MGARDIIPIAESYKQKEVYECLQDDYDVLKTSNGAEGWQLALVNLPAVILADLALPGMSGIDLCAKIKQDDRTYHIPFVIFADADNVQLKINGLNEGADDYITKPFHEEELKARVRNLIRAQKNMLSRYSSYLYLQPEERNIPSADEQFLLKCKQLL